MTLENRQEPPITIADAGKEDVPAVIRLLYMRPPCSWMRNLSTASLAAFVTYAIEDSRSVLLLARPAGDRDPIGYLFAIPDPAAFWLGFARGNPVISQAIWWFRRRRAAQRRREVESLASSNRAAVSLPEFSWAAAYRGNARIVGVYVRPERRDTGVSRNLYLALFERLKARRISLVEEHMGPDYNRCVGAFPGGLGWRLEACGCGGRKVSKTL